MCVGIFVLFLKFRGKALSFSQLSILIVDLSLMAFIMLRYVPSLTTLIRCFTINDVELYQVLFLHLLRWSCNFYPSFFFFFFFLVWSIRLLLWILNNPFFPGMNPPWMCCMILFINMYVGFGLLAFCLDIFASILIRKISLYLLGWAWECSIHLNFFWNSSRRICISSFW